MCLCDCLAGANDLAVTLTYRAAGAGSPEGCTNQSQVFRLFARYEGNEAILMNPAGRG